MPRARISGTGAMPDPSFRFEPGQCITLTSCSASSACSPSSTQTQCAAHRRGDARCDAARDTRCSSARRTSACTIAISSRDSDACVWTSASCCGRERARPLRAARASTTRRSAARRRRAAVRSPAPCQRARIATLSSIDARVVFLQPRAAPRASQSIMHLPIVARRPLSATASNTASVSCTVSIVSTAVVPLREQLGGGEPRRRAQRRRRVRRFHRPDARAQPVHQRQIVGVAAKQRLAEMDVGLDEARAGRSRRARR